MNYTPRTLLLTGLPRAGTTLCCHILNDHENLVALHEPLTPTDFDPRQGKVVAISRISDFVDLTREKVLRDGVALTRQKNGRVPENPVAATAVWGLRNLDVSLSEISVASQVKNNNFTLSIKHNALFTALLPDLERAFPVYGVVRNPLSVLGSWHSVNLPVNNGRLPAGEMFCETLRQQLQNTTDVIHRQLLILEWFFSRFALYLGENILRYEEFVVEPACVGRVLRLNTEYVGNVGGRKSLNDSYDLAVMDRLYKRLISFGDAIWAFYSRADIDHLMDNINSQE